MYQERPGPLDDDRYADVVVMAGVLTRAILGVQAGALDAALGVGLYDIGGDSAEVHQASGMVSAQLDIGVGEALTRLRARAVADGTTVGLIAAEVVARRVRLEA